MKIPQSVIDIIQFEVDTPLFDPSFEVDKARERALEAIENYKEAKRVKERVEAKRKELKEFIESAKKLV